MTVAEGGARTVTVRRTAPGNLGEAAVQVRSAPGTASPADFTPVAQTVRFGRGEREKTVRLDARADGLGEGPESYTVALSDPTGDAALGARARLTATIPASAADARPPGIPATGSPPRCAACGWTAAAGAWRCASASPPGCGCASSAGGAAAGCESAR